MRGYAKLNLALAVTGRRADGYHLLRSVMQSVSLCDVVTVQRAPSGIQVSFDDPAIRCDASNTVWRAAQQFFLAVGYPSGVRVTVEKRIPYEAGMGSASADAAATLRGLNTLYGTPLDGAALCALGERVGADVPFGLIGGTRLAEGIGERLTALPALAHGAFVILKPPEGMCTPLAFARYDTLEAPIQPNIDTLCAALASGNLRAVGAAAGNVFEQVCTAETVPQAKRALLEAGAYGTAMTGSGTAVFGLFEEEALASASADRLRGGPWRVFVAIPTDCGVCVDA